MSSDGPAMGAPDGASDVLSYESLAQACTGPGALQQLRTLIRPFLRRCWEQWGVASLLRTDTAAATLPSEEVLGRICDDIRAEAETFAESPDEWKVQKEMEVSAFVYSHIHRATAQGCCEPLLHRCLDEWDVASLGQAQTTKSQPLSEELLQRIRKDLQGTKKFTGSLKVWEKQATAQLLPFLEQRTLLVTARYCSLPRRRDTVGAERFGKLLRLLSFLENDACVSAEEREELLLVAAAQRWDADTFDDALIEILKEYGVVVAQDGDVVAAQGGDVVAEQSEDADAFGQLWNRTQRSIRGAICGRYSFTDDVVDDLVGETAVRLVKAIHTFDVSLSTFRAFARRIVVFVVTDFLRARHGRAEAAKNADAAPGDAGDHHDASTGPNADGPHGEAHTPPVSKPAHTGVVVSVVSEVDIHEVRRAPEAVSGEHVQDASVAPGAKKSAERVVREVPWPDDVDVVDPHAYSPVDPRILRVQEFFHHAFESASALHRKLALGFNVLHEYPASRIVAELSDQLFGVLTHRLSADYPEGAPLSAWIESTTLLLQSDLRREPALAGKTFETYYTGKTVVEKNANVSHWSNDLKSQTIARMARAR